MPPAREGWAIRTAPVKAGAIKDNGMVFEYSVIVFFTQLIFIGCRTWNVRSIASKNIPQVLISGTFVHLSWLVSVAIGAVSMHEIIVNFRMSFLPIVLSSLIGGLIGSYISMKSKNF